MSFPTETRHLNDEQMYALLEAETPAENDHLRTCAVCRDELSALQTALGGFRASLTSLAGTAPELSHRQVAASGFMWGHLLSRYGMAAACAAALVLGGVMLSVRGPHTADHGPVAPVAQAQTSDSDEALLAGIDTDLSASVPPPLEPLAPSAESSTTSSATR